MFKKLPIILSLLFLSVAYAEEYKEPLYQVEIIIFQNKTDHATKIDQSLTQPPLTSDYSNSIELISDSNDGVIQPFELLPFSKKILNREHWLLSKKGGFPILLHYSWLQPMNKRHKIHIKKDAKIENTNQTWSVDGSLSIAKSNYYDIAAELNFSLPINNKDVRFAMTQKRRLRSDEVHYMDHPLIGMIIKVHPLDKKHA